jgi:hypothetical protein
VLPWQLPDVDFDAQPPVDRKLIAKLASLRFLDNATNVLLIGPPGVGNAAPAGPWPNGAALSHSKELGGLLVSYLR